MRLKYLIVLLLIIGFASIAYGGGTVGAGPNSVKCTDSHGGEKSCNNVTDDAQVKRSEMGAANGVATLDVNSKLPHSQLPALQPGDIPNNAANTSGNSGTVSSINGLISAGANINISGSGTPASPYGISAIGGSSIGIPAFKNLAVTVTSSTAMTVTADAVQTVNSFYSPYVLTSVSVSIATGTSGAGGLDTGSIAASRWYYVYAISNGTTTSGIISLSATSPTLPNGYTYFARLGAVTTNSSSSLLGTVQKGRSAQYTNGGANLSALPTIASGTFGTYPSTFAALPVAGNGYVAPPTASRIGIVVPIPSSALGSIAPNGSYQAGGNATNPAPIAIVGAAISWFPNYAWFTLESSNIYAVSNSTLLIQCLGWEDNL